MRFETQTNLYGDIPLAERFKALDTQFAITQGHINALISETELRELLNGDKTMYSAMNDIKIDINGLRANLSSLTTEVDGEYGITAINNKLAEYEETIDGFSANFERITEVVDHTGYNSYTEAVQANINAGIEGFNSTIQSTYYTKNDVYTKSEVDSELQGVSGAFTSAISNVQSQIDNKIETWCRDGVPTASNYPASDWTTSAIKDQHIGDLYYDTKNGYAYQFTKQNNVYSWNVITTSGIGDALTIAGNKKRVFVTQPTPPYEIGDLWVQGSSGDIMRCGTARASGSYNSSDWVKASKYTDDTKANQVASNLASNYSTTTQIQQNSNGIITTAISNVDGANFISQINQTAESISINADKINLNGTVTANETFTIDTSGYMHCVGGTLGGWFISDEGFYTYTLFNNRPTLYTVFKSGDVQSEGASGRIVMAMGASGLSDEDLKNAPFRVDAGANIFATSLTLLQSITIESPISASFYKMSIGRHGITSWMSTNNSYYNKNSNLTSLESKGITFWSKNTTGGWDSGSTRIGMIGHYYDQTADEYGIVLGKNANNAKIILGNCNNLEMQNGRPTLTPYITVGQNIIQFDKPISPNVRIANSNDLTEQTLLTYQRLGFYQNINNATQQVMTLWSNIDNDSSINDSAYHLPTGAPALKICNRARTHCVIITDRGITLWKTRGASYVYDKTVVSFSYSS